MAFFPFFIDIAEKNCLVVGGGMVAFRKIEQLLPFDCNITVVSPNLCEPLQKIKTINWIKRDFLPTDIADHFFVIAATSNEQINTQIATLCNKKNILVNVVDVKEECSFFFPSLYKNGPICAGITTGGQSPQISKLVRKNMEEHIPSYYGAIANRLGKLRQSVKNKYPTQNKRSAVFKILLEKLLETKNTISDIDLEKIWKGTNP